MVDFSAFFWGRSISRSEGKSATSCEAIKPIRPCPRGYPIPGESDERGVENLGGRQRDCFWGMPMKCLGFTMEGSWGRARITSPNIWGFRPTGSSSGLHYKRARLSFFGDCRGSAGHKEKL